MTVTSVAVATTKSLFGKCNCTVDGDVGTGDFLLVLGILHLYGRAHVGLLLSPGSPPIIITPFLSLVRTKAREIIVGPDYTLQVVY